MPCFTGEVMLAGWTDSHNGGAKVTFWLPDDADLEAFRRMTVKKGKTAGQRLMCVLVEIDEQEQPVQPDLPTGPRSRASSDAHLMITGPDFVRYCNEVADNEWTPDKVRLWAKHKMNVDSLSELDTDPLALKRFHEQIRRPFERWMEHNNGVSDREPGEDDDLE